MTKLRTNLIQNKDGEIMIIEDNLLLSDGSRVTVGGAITRPNGEIVQLEEGDSLFIDGTIVTEEELMEMDISGWKLQKLIT